MMRKSPPVNIYLPIQLEQDASAYLPEDYPLEKSMLTPQQLVAKRKDFLQRFFSVWSSHDEQFCINADDQECHSIISMQEESLKDFEQTLGFDRFYRAYPLAWLDKIKTNMALDQLADAIKQKPHYGIMIANEALRTLPTAEPNFNDVLTPGEGYPFDRLQESAIWLGTPVRIIHTSKDNHWLLVLGPGLLGWIPNTSVAFVNKPFMQNYQNSTFATPIVRQIDVPINQQQTQRLYLGSLFPLINSDNESYQLAIPVMGSHQHAVLQSISLPKTLLQPWPLKPTPYQFTLLMNQLVGMPYGWGDLDFNSDCSGILRRLYTAFAIWLPRNSYSQAHFGGKFFSLADIPIEQRKQVLTAGNAIIPKPIPYLTSVRHKLRRLG